MFCIQCGKESEDSHKNCTNCGVQFLSNVESNDSAEEVLSVENGWNIRRIIIIIIIVGSIGFGAYNATTRSAIEKNNEAILSFEDGDTETAINQLNESLEESTTTENKVNALKNLGYIYDTIGMYDDAIKAFNDALKFTEKDGFNYYLISGEIAYIEQKFNIALLNFNKAYKINPKDSQVNSSLSCLYLDPEEISPDYENYPQALFHAKIAHKYDDQKSDGIIQSLAMAYFYNNNYDETISLLTSLDLNKTPNMSYWIGLSYVAKEDPENAKIYFQTAIDNGVELEQEIYDYLTLIKKYGF